MAQGINLTARLLQRPDALPRGARWRRMAQAGKPTPAAPPDLLRIAREFDRQRQRHGLANVPADEVSRLVALTPPISDARSGGDLQHKMAHRVGELWPGLQNITLVPPRTASWNATVFRVQSLGKTVAVAKSFGPKWRDFLCEVTALWHLRQKPGERLATVSMLGAGHTLLNGQPQPLLLTEAPGDEDLENLQVAARTSTRWQRYLRYVKQAGSQVAAVHQRFLPSTDATAIDESRNEHLAHVRRMPHGSLAALRDRGWLTPFEYTQWEQHSTAIADAYAALPHSDLHLSVTLGDCYAANFVVHREGFGLSLVDVQTTLWNMGNESATPTGIADAREDVARFLEALTMRGLCLGLSPRQLRSQTRAFWRGYTAHAPAHAVRRDDPHLQLYRLRYQLVVWRAVLEGRTEKVSLREAHRYLQYATRRIDAGLHLRKSACRRDESLGHAVLQATDSYTKSVDTTAEVPN